MSWRSRVLAIACGVAVAMPTARVLAQHAEHGADERVDSTRLGHIDFPTSAAPAAHASFVRGVLLLHSFQYPEALAAFRDAQRLDPGDVMSYWGEAMTYTHPVWNQQDTAAARAGLRRLAPTRAARRGKARTPRERGYLEAVEILYGEGSKPARDTAYSDAMRRLHEAHPGDAEAAAFYAVSLLGLNQGDREPLAYARAADIAEALFRRYPRHPGAAHYLIHAVDDPEHAARGLEAARAYSDIAPSAGHAQHMTSHIFIARGMWDDVVRANLRSNTMPTAGRRAYGHGTHWLAYGLLQQGRVREARAWLDSMLAYQRDVARGTTPAVRGRADADFYAIAMTAAHVLDTQAWDSPLARLRFDTTYLPGLLATTVADFFVGTAAARRAGRQVDVTPGSRGSDRLLADSTHAAIASRLARARAAGATARGLVEAEVMEKMLRAEIRLIDAQRDSAVALLRAAAEQVEALPFEFGPPVMGKPPRERAAEILHLYYSGGSPADALVELEKAERYAPGRTQARLRRAEVLLDLGRTDEAVREFRELATVWRDADVTFAGRAEVRWGSSVLPSAARDRSIAVDTLGYTSGTLALRGALYRPTSPGPHPALVVLHGSVGCWWFGDADMLGRMFAAEGYVTFFPCRRGVGLSKGQGVAVMEQLRREGFTDRNSEFGARATELLTTTQLEDVRAAIAAMRARADVDPSRVAVTGVSYGGILTLLAAEADSTLRAGVAFAPAGMNWGWNAPLRERLLAGARRIRVPVLVVQAENDFHVGPVSEVPTAIRAGGGNASGKLYPAVGSNVQGGHGLMIVAPDLWREDVLAFLAKRVR
jgi:dienelactone hydrolase/tetratricopeptide (TPR) repeat protein